MLSLATSLTSHACLNVERRREHLDHIPMGSPPSDRPSWASLYASASQRFIEEVASISFSVKLGNFVKFSTFDNAWKWKSEPVCRPHQVRASSTSLLQIGDHIGKKFNHNLFQAFVLIRNSINKAIEGTSFQMFSSYLSTLSDDWGCFEQLWLRPMHQRMVTIIEKPLLRVEMGTPRLSPWWNVFHAW